MIIPLSTCIQSQFLQGKFIRWDVLVRISYIEWLKGTNDYGERMYTKLQTKRVGNSVDAVTNFKSLVSSVEVNGLKPDFPIPVTNDLKMSGGSHRLACALCFNEPFVFVEHNSESDRLWGKYKQKFTIKQMGKYFGEGDMKILRELYQKWIAPYLNQHILSGFLWSPSHNFWNDILSEKSIVYKKELAFPSRETFEKFVYDIYELDDIAKWKVEKKLTYMRDSKCLFFCIEMSDPKYRKKELNNKDLSTVGEQIKKQVRGKYAGLINPYFHDIIIHLADNEQDSIKIMNQINGKNYP